MNLILGMALWSMILAGESQPYVSHFTLAYRGPVAYSDSGTKTIFYVESDGRHVSAIQFDGKVAWTRDPYSEGQLERMPYRVKDRKIVSIGRTDPSGLPKGLWEEALSLDLFRLRRLWNYRCSERQVHVSRQRLRKLPSPPLQRTGGSVALRAPFRVRR